MLRVIAGLGFPALVLGFVIFMVAQRSGTVSRFVRARAFSPETARRPASVGVEFAELLQGPVKRGLLLRTGDGLYYVCVPRLLEIRRQRKRLLTVVAVMAAVAIAVLLVL